MQYVLGWPLITLINTGLLIIGLAAVVAVQELPAGTTRDYIGPFFIIQNAPVFLYGLFLAGLMAAALSTADSVIQLCVSFVSNNIVKGQIKPDIDDKALLSMSRVLSIIFVVFVGALTLFKWKWIVYIVHIVGDFSHLVFCAYIICLYWRRANKFGAHWSVIGGLAAF
jgi:Na+/pantothenate symporter